MTSDEIIKAQKAAEWLLHNDPLIESLSMQMADTPVQAIVFAAFYGNEIRSRVAIIAENMVVTDEEREFGYPAPETEEEKQEKREEIRRIMLLSTRPII
jgi:hypothetical protein